MTDAVTAGIREQPERDPDRCGAPPRIAVVGVSEGAVCGVRDYAGVLTDGLHALGVNTTEHWLTRRHTALAPARAELAGWRTRLARELRAQAPDAVLLHYSVFSYSHRGVPVFVPAFLRALRSARAPVISVLHEMAYPFRHRGWRAKTLAVSQRLALVDVMRTSAAALVTTDWRCEWLSSRVWLPRRPLALSPVHSALPRPQGSARADERRPLIGLFGYSDDDAILGIVLDSVRALRASHPSVELALLGARAWAASAQWQAGARERGIVDALSFSGILALQELSDALARTDVLLFADAGGPSSRNSSLAASLASGSAVVALDGVRRWQEPVDAAALALAGASADELAAVVGALLGDRPEREALGERGRRFARERMSVAASARAVVDLCLSQKAAAAARSSNARRARA